MCLASAVGVRQAYAALIISAALAASCGPYLPPTTVPPAVDPALDPFKRALQTYVDQTQPYRKQAAQAGEQVPGKSTPTDGAEASVRVRQNALADALKMKIRPMAKQGELFGSAAGIIRERVTQIFDGPRHDLLMDALAEQQDEGSKAPQQFALNDHVDAPRVPPVLADELPPLPKQLEYDFLGRTLLLRDVDADVVVDFLPDTMPEQPPAGVASVPPAPVPADAAEPLPMPAIRGGIVFGLIGDSGSGDMPQELVAQAMLRYFTNGRRFPFVLMLGDNLYDDDYMGEFSVPYKPLLDRGVQFFATLGNHDRDLEIHFKPFNMNDRDYYSFDRGNARFVALNSNHPTDQVQMKWLDTVFQDAGNKWRICFFHHPLYSSGEHADESRDVIRPALESALVRNKVDVVFSGHEHLYERVTPQKRVRYFVSGGGGRKLYDFRRSDFDEVGISEHHFMIAELAGDRLLFEAITPAHKVLDCGILYRTPQATPKGAEKDKDVAAWLASCERARPSID